MTDDTNPQSRTRVRAAPKNPNGSWNTYDTTTLGDLPSGPPDPDEARSQYGGNSDRSFDATGFFDVREADDRWWLVDPDGHPFLTVGFAPTRLGDRIDLEDAAAVLRDTNVNTLGCWSDWRDFRELDEPFPYTRFGGFLGSFREANDDRHATSYDRRFEQVAGASVSLFDPYEDDFAEHCYEAAARFADTADDPYLVGIYADNELPFWPMMLDAYLDLPVGDPGRNTADKWLAEQGLTPGKVTHEDRTAFDRFVMEEYYRTVHDAVREYDSNHLFFGNRLCGYDHGLLREASRDHFEIAGQYVDVVPVNLYTLWTPPVDLLEKWTEWAGAPFHITEFYAKGMDSGMLNRGGAGWVVETQADRGRYYQNTVLSLLQSRGCVGWHWHTFRDPFESGWDARPTWSNKGLIGKDGTPYEYLQTAMADLNGRLYSLAARQAGTR